MLFLILTTTLFHLASAQTCKVEVEQGWLQGALLDLITGDGQYCAFKGVSYAAPPVGKLRFKATQPALPWDGVKNATEFGSICPQYVFYEQQYLPGNEDCLFLNIYTLGLNSSSTFKAPLPVMFFIHGGYFKSGTGNDYGPDLLISNGVIVVTINYRLDVLGFLCMDTVDVPGNAGMKDQVEAMRWVQKNIAKFGGDPDNVTIFGNGAGSASVGYHLYSPMSKGLFKRGIMMSGSPIVEWAQGYLSRLRSFSLGRELGLNTDSDKDLLDFLQNQPVESIVNTFPPVLAIDLMLKDDVIIIPFCVVPEKKLGQEQFISRPLNELVKLGNDHPVDVLAGTTDFEGLYILQKPLNSTTRHYRSFPEYYVPADVLLQRSPTESLNRSDAIQDFYFGYHQSVTLPNKKIPEFLKYYSERMFSVKLQIFLDKLVPQLYNAKRYFYRFSTVSERNIIGNKGASYGLVGAAHTDDLFYLFNMNVTDLPAVDTSSESYKLIQRSCKLWTNFAKYGNPTPDPSLGILWPAYDNLAKTYLDIGEHLKLGVQPNAKSLAFWMSIFKLGETNSTDVSSPLLTPSVGTATAFAAATAFATATSSRSLSTSSASASPSSRSLNTATASSLSTIS